MGIASVSGLAAETPAALSPAGLPGKGLAQHPFLYAGEWDYRKPVQTLFIVRDGKVDWTFDIPIKAADGNLQEFGDATRLSNGNIVFSRKTGASIVTPEKKIVWDHEAPKGTEIHVAQPLDQNRVLIMQNGDPAKWMIINTTTDQTEKEGVLPTGNPKSPHGQFRRIRMTRAGTLLVAHMDHDKVVEYDSNGTEIWSAAIPSPWSAVRLKNGNTLVSSNKGFVREFDKSGATVWEFSQPDVPEIRLFNIQEVNRLANGDTVISNWCPNGVKDPKDWPQAVQILEVTPEKKVVWALRSWDEPANLGPATAIQLLDEPGIPENGDLLR